MIHKCTNCDSALTYNPSIRLMECMNCGSFYEVGQFSIEEEEFEQQTGTASYGSTDMFQSDWDEPVCEESVAQEQMECNIYSCTACGAELAVNGVEASTFCAYCGQPTIVFSRVSKELKPKYIIPFQFEKDQAIGAIRERLNKGFFVPKAIRDFEVERVRGIYVPFWLYDVYYHDKQYLRGTVGSGKHKKTRYYYREGEVSLNGMTADASRQLSDESSQRLEPYDTRRMRPFDIGYMSGFYADTYDVETKETDKIIIQRARELYDKEIKSNIPASNVRVLTSDPEHRINNVDYVMLPVWFLTFRHMNEPYTILVNGQTGKIIGAVPIHKKKVAAIILGAGAALSAVLTPFMYMLISSDFADGGENMLGFLFTALFISGMLYLFGWGNFAAVKKSIRLTKASTMHRFVKNRQEEE